MTEVDTKQPNVDTALENADAAALRKMLDKKSEEVELLISSMSIMVDNRKLGPRPINENGLNAIRDVALAAIELAKQVAAQSKDSHE